MDLELDEELGETSHAVAVSWQNVVGATATANNLTKTAATGWGNAGASSTQSISGDGFVEFTTAENGSGKIAGLSVGDTNQDYKDVDFGIHPSGNGTYYIYEAGKLAGNFGAYAANDIFRVESVERVVKYYRNATLVFTSTRVPQFPLLVDTALFHTSSTINNVDLSDFRFRNTVNVTVSGNTLTKPTGLPDAWNNSGAISVRTIKADTGHIQFTSAQTTHGKIAGLSNTDTNQHFNTVRFGILLPRLSPNGPAQVFETGVLRFTDSVNWTTTDVFRVAVVINAMTGQPQVQYLKNGNVLFTSAQAVTYPLFADTAFFHDGGSMTVTIDDTFWSAVVGAEAIGNKLVGNVAGYGNAGAISLSTIAAGAGHVEFTASETKATRAVGLNNVNGSANLTDIDFAIELGSNGSFFVKENGVNRGTFGTYVTGDVFRVEVNAIGAVEYKRNGVTFFTSTGVPTYPLFADAALSTLGATVTNVTVVDAP